MKEERIAGKKITLHEGRRYVASRSMAVQGVYKYDVFIDERHNDNDTEVLRIESLNYDEANRFINEFNNGVTSFDGRKW
ncbi:MAG: hypothetical protein GY765_06405 [bacterium]|nr:hypothetical protein [bacterium]